MDYSRLKRKIQTVGTWYFVTFITEVLIHYDQLEDAETKRHLIEKLKKSASCGEISFASTRAKVNAMLAIIRAKQVRAALTIIVEETNANKVPQDTVCYAETLIRYLDEGRIKLPDENAAI